VAQYITGKTDIGSDALMAGAWYIFRHGFPNAKNSAPETSGIIGRFPYFGRLCRSANAINGYPFDP
jgi:hypothetical protein